MGKPQPAKVVLAVAPVSRGIGYIVFEDPKTPIDWGVRTTRVNKDVASQRFVESLISFYQPDVLVLEQLEQNSNRERVRKLNQAISIASGLAGVEVHWVNRNNIQTTFSQFGSKTKFGIAKTIAAWLPELGVDMPRYRKPWKNEDHAMAMFEAAALALTYYYIRT